jgi:hypothetical protein
MFIGIGMGVCKKIKYWSEKSAKKALHKQQKWDARVKRVYFCSECKAFHLTSSSHSWSGK